MIPGLSRVKRRLDFEFIGIVVALIFGLFMLIVGVTATIRDNIAESKCLEEGYPRHKVKFGKIYCIRRVDQTDVTLTLEEIKRQRP